MRETCRWVYKDKDGNVVGHVRRLEEDKKADQLKSSKQVIPYFNESGQSGIPEGLPADYRIYGIESLSNFKETIFIVEGEKCAHALITLGYQALTSLGGCGQVEQADWSILQKASKIILMPDNDEAGQRYASTVFNRLRSVTENADIKLLQFRIGNKADICDYLKTLPWLSGWNELSDLTDHPERFRIRESFENHVTDNLEDIPASWKFIVTKSKHKLIALNDFSNMQLPKRALMLAPWLTEGSINMVFADRGIGKTFFCLSCAVALANGESFLSYRAAKPLPVLYLDGEMQAAAMQERLNLLTQGKRTKQPLSIFTPDCQDLTDHIPDIGDSMGRSEINELIESVSPKVVFIDNISTFIRTGNENEGDSWAPVQEWAVQLRKKGIAVVFIHHANKEGKQRGSHKKEDVMDVVIQLKRPDDFLQGTDDTRIQVKYTKSRHLDAKHVQDMEATLITKDGMLSWTWEAGDQALIQAMDMLKAGFSMSEIADDLGVSKSTVHRWKQKAQSLNL